MTAHPGRRWANCAPPCGFKLVILIIHCLGVDPHLPVIVSINLNMKPRPHSNGGLSVISDWWTVILTLEVIVPSKLLFKLVATSLSFLPALMN